LVGLTCALTRVLDWHQFLICAGAAAAGTLVDSFLGATIERRRLIANNGVNFLSTVVAAGLGFLL
jgi:uncharacterized membrane protein